MDIEGAEYGVLIDTPAHILRRFRIMVIEFHSLDTIFSRAVCTMLAAIVDKVLADFAVCHLHPNNCFPARRSGALEIPPIMEFTFLRRDRLRPAGQPLVFPHPLDAACVPSRPDYPLPACWQTEATPT